MATSNEFGHFFRDRRAALGLSLSEFCRLNGFDKGNISRLERGLTRPPTSPELLQTYADALQLLRNSEDWKAFMGHAAIARGKLPTAVSEERAADVEEMLRKLGRRLHDPWVKAWNLEQWSSTREAQEILPTLIRQLIHASTEQPTRIEIPGDVQRHGWDGIIESPKTSLFVPAGVSGWEISVENHPKRKAEAVFRNRKKGPLGLPPSKVTFVFVTSRKWDKKQEWRDEKRELGRWKNVEVYDSVDLEAWLEAAPGVDAWIAERLGLRPAGVISISDYWESLSRLAIPRLRPEVFLASRKKTAETLQAFLLGAAGVMPFECRSPVEALDFVAAYLALTASDDAELAMDEEEQIRTQSRTLVVKDRAQWDGLSQASGPLNLFPIPSLSLTSEELITAVSRGHRLLIAGTQFSNHRLQPTALPRPSRYDLDKALRKSGFAREDADKAARTAGGSLSVLKRHISTIPDSRLPKWCSDTELSDFMPLLLVGAWDDANAMDRTVLSRLSGRPYGELQVVANRMMLVEDAPLTRIESRWRLVSPEDSWLLVGERVTDHLLDSFETIAIDVLTRQDELFEISARARLVASIKGTLDPNASALLLRGISETAAIIGSGFGPLAKFPDAQRRAARIVHAALNNATWLRWVALSDLLPLLAEAAPAEFLDAVRKNPSELAKVLADDEKGNPLLSRCKHAGLLWALECLAWSPDLLSKVCTVLAKLDEVDSGTKWGNRPAASLREILLTWYPQTAAGVEKRIAVLNSLAERAPTAAWKLLFAMLPEGYSHADLTHRPIWRDWASAWREGCSGADYWRQVDAAADLVVRLVGNNLTRWFNVLDELQSVPEPHRSELIGRLQNLPIDDIAPEDRRHLAEHLRKTVQGHRDFADAFWALPSETVDLLEQALQKLLPVGVSERHAWLFAHWVELEGFRDDFHGMEAEVSRLRVQALTEIINQEGFDGVLKFAEMVESPGQVGATLALTECAPDDLVLPGLLTSPNASHQSLAANYARIRLSRNGSDWVRSLGLNSWSVIDAAVFLAQGGLDPDAWSFAKSLDPAIFREYWEHVLIHGRFELDQPQLEFASQRLVEAGRCEEAIGVLSRVTFDKVTVSQSVLMDILGACLAWKQSHPGKEFGHETLHKIGRLFGWLQETIPFGNDESTRRLAELERDYLRLLGGFGASPDTLVRFLSEDPEFFAKVIQIIFRSKKEQEIDAKSSEKQQQAASHWYRLLMNWNRIPGIQPDGSIDEEQLLQWLESARSLCRDSGHLEVADSQIGEMLASWPQPDDESGMWPCEQICDAIEEANSDDLDHGFQIGILNSRGVTTRSPLDGGDLERKEAAKYRQWAERSEVDWPRTATSLRSVASSYDFEAQREDARAAEAAQNRH